MTDIVKLFQNPAQLSILINFLLLLITASVFVLNVHFTKKSGWISLYIEYNNRYARIRWDLPHDILSQGFDLERLQSDPVLITNMREYFDLCSEEFYLSRTKKWIAKELWSAWEAGIKYYIARPAFKAAWGIISKDEEYYKGFEEYLNDMIQEGS